MLLFEGKHTLNTIWCALLFFFYFSGRPTFRMLSGRFTSEPWYLWHSLPPLSLGWSQSLPEIEFTIPQSRHIYIYMGLCKSMKTALLYASGRNWVVMWRILQSFLHGVAHDFLTLHLDYWKTKFASIPAASPGTLPTAPSLLIKVCVPERAESWLLCEMFTHSSVSSLPNRYLSQVVFWKFSSASLRRYSEEHLR